MRIRLIFCLLAVAAPAAAQVRAASGLIIHERFTTTGSGPVMGPQESTRVTYLTPTALRQASSAGTELIVLFESETIISIDHRTRSFVRMNADELNQRLSQVLDNPPDQARENIERMRRMFGLAEVEPEIMEVGEGEPVAGYATDKYIVSMYPLEFEIWSAPDLIVAPSFYDALKMNAPKSPFMRMDKLYNAFKQLPGVIMRSVFTMKGGSAAGRSTTEVFKIEEGDIPDSRFQVPEGYTEKQYAY